jgi:anti-sigma regulatory factor (Ser/Thr protein kinase)
MDVTGREHFKGTFPADASTVTAVRRALAELAAEAGGTEEQVASVRLAVSEALTNSVVHAYRHGSAGSVYVSADVASTELWVLIADDGCGLRPVADSPGLGMGLALIAESCDGFAIVSRSSGGIEVRMRFNLGVAVENQPRGSDSSAMRPAWPVFSTIT